MTRFLLDDDTYRLDPRGRISHFVLALWRRQLQPGWLLLNKSTGDRFRLDEEDHELMDKFARHLAAFWKAPDVHPKTRRGRRDQASLILADLAGAIELKRSGDLKAFRDFAGMNHRSFVEYAWDRTIQPLADG